MRLYILGKNRDGKGTALEELTSAILSQLGYTVVRNYIGYGGHEIDVEAKYEQKTIGETKMIPVVCECKAHDKPIVIGDWLKFLGKVLVERMSNAQTMGVMIALSGVNGNVQSNYDKLPDKSFLSLICNDQLTDAVCQHYKLKTVEEIKSFIEHKTIRPIETIDLVYYEKEIWWLVSFVHGEFTVLSDKLVTVDSRYIDAFLDNLQEVSSFTKSGYRDVLQEEISRIRMEIIAKSVVFLLMKHGPLKRDDLLEKTKQLTHQPDIDKNELIKTIEACPCIEIIEADKAILADLETEEMVEFYRWYLFGQFIVDSIVQNYFREHINDDLLDYIIHLQHDIELTKEQREDSLFILKLSPSALLYALHPDDIIVRSRTKATAAIEQINKFHTERFMGCLTDNFVLDLEKGQFSTFYSEKYGLKEFHVEKNLSLMFKDGTRDKAIEYKNRMALFELDGQVILTALFDKMPTKS